MADEETITFEPKEEKPVAETQAAETDANATAAENEASADEEVTGENPEQEENPKPAKKADPLQRRIDDLTKQRYDAQRERDEALAKLKKYEAPENLEDGKKPETDIDALAERKALEIVAKRERDSRINSWASAGNKEFGAEEFTEKSNIVASLGAADRPEFMQIITDPTVIENGHRVVAALADDPEEAARILSLPPVAMSAALVKFESRMEQTKTKAPKPVSKAPEPIKPISGTAKASDEPADGDSDEEWFRKRNAQIAARRSGTR